MMAAIVIEKNDSRMMAAVEERAVIGKELFDMGRRAGVILCRVHWSEWSGSVCRNVKTLVI